MDIAAERKKRRVTFSNRQERTDFITDEPTMHIRPPVESEMASVTQSTISTPGSASQGQDSLIPRLRGFGSGVDDEADDTESSSEVESSSGEEDATAVDMELATVSGSGRQWEDDQTMDLTDAIGSIEDRIPAESSGAERESSDEGEAEGICHDLEHHGDESVDMEFTRATGAIVRGRYSSGIASSNADGAQDMDITGKSREKGDDEDDESAIQLTEAMGGFQGHRREHLRARDSLALHRSSTRPTLTERNRRLSLEKGSFAVTVDIDNGNDDEEEEPMDLTDAGSEINKASSHAEELQSLDGEMDMSLSAQSPSFIEPCKPASPRRPRPSLGGSLPRLQFRQLSSTRSPSTSRFRRSLLAGVSESPKSPARRVQVPLETLTPASKHILPGQWVTGSARKASPDHRDDWNASPPKISRKSSGGALPSAHSLRLGKAPSSRTNMMDPRSSIVAAVLPQIQPQGRSLLASEQHSVEEASASSDEESAMPFMDKEANYEERKISQPPPRNLTLSEFFSLSGMNFHDDTRLLKVRVAPPRDLKKFEDGSVEKRIQQFKAMAGSVPMLDVLVQACQELKQSVSDGSAVLNEIEERFVESPPDLVRELLSLSNESEKKEMESQFKLQKQAARAIAREGYLGWCLDNQYGPEVIASLEATKEALEADLVKVNDDWAKMQHEVLPVLRDRRQALRQQVEHMKSRRARIESCPIEDLEFLHAGMAEVLPELQSRRAVNREKNNALERIRSKLEENLSRKAELEMAIEQARKVCAQIYGYTRAEAARLAAEIRHIERLHLWKIHSASLSKIHLSHDSIFDIVILLCQGGLCKSIDLTLTPSTRGDALLEEVLEALKDDIAVVGEQRVAWQIPHLVRHISNVWTSCRRLQSEVHQLSLHFPTEVIPLIHQQISGSPRCVSLQSSIVLTRQSAKVSASVRVNLESLLYGKAPHRVLHLDSREHSISVKSVYGNVDATSMTAHLTDSLSSRENLVLGSGVLASAFQEVVESVST